ncbi:MAG TPA: hypothetical protein VIL17_04205 [Coriobacteriia bacterium]
MGERELGLLLVAGLLVISWGIGRFWKPAAGAALMLLFGLVLLADDYFGGPLPGSWGAGGSAMAGAGAALLWGLCRSLGRTT